MDVADLPGVLFVVLTGVLAGVLVSVEIAVVPLLGALPGAEFSRQHRFLDSRFDPAMPWLARVALVCGLGATWTTDRTAARITLGASVLALVAVALVSELSNVRMNRRVDSWPESAPPPGWDRLRGRWARANRWRTLAAVVSFVSAVLGLVLMSG